MPCNQVCEVKRLSLILKDIKVDKLKILRASYDLTDQIRRDYPERYEEMTRKNNASKSAPPGGLDLFGLVLLCDIAAL